MSISIVAYDTWQSITGVESVREYIRNVLSYSVGHGEGYDIDALEAEYRDNINKALPDFVSLVGNTIYGPEFHQDQTWDGELDLEEIVTQMPIRALLSSHAVHSVRAARPEEVDLGMSVKIRLRSQPDGTLGEVRQGIIHAKRVSATHGYITVWIPEYVGERAKHGPNGVHVYKGGDRSFVTTASRRRVSDGVWLEDGASQFGFI